MESRKRSLVKTVTYRTFLTLLLAAISWYFTGNVSQTITITIVFSVSAMVIYYLHERIWSMINWGKKEKDQLT